MKDLNRDSIDFGTTRIAPLFRSIFFPTLLSLVFTSLLTVVDGIFVGQGVGSDALAAVNIVAPLFLFTTGMAMMFGVGVSVVASIHLAQGNRKAADINVTQALFAAPVLMALLAVIVYIFREPFLRLLGSSDALLPYAMDYLVALLPGCVSMLLEMIGTFIIRMDGSPKFASMVGIIPSALNVFLDWLFVFPLDMGVAGSSLATTVCCTIAAVMVLWYMGRKSITVHLYRLKWTRTSLHLTVRNLGYMVRSGFSSLLGELAMAVMMLTGNYVFIRALGEDGVAAFSVACYLYPIVFMVNNAVAQSAQPIISYNHGAHLNARVREALHLSVKTAVVCGIVCMCILVFGARPLISMFLQPGSMPFELAVKGLPIFACAAIFFALNISLIGYCQSVEDNRRATCYMILRGLVFLVPAFILLPKFLSVPGIWMAVPVTEALTLIVILFTRKHAPSSSDDGQPR